MNIKQLLTEQKSLISQMSDENSAFLAKYNYRTWLAESLGKNQSFLIAHDDYELTETQLAHYQQGLTKLQHGVPLAYVTGHQPFWQGDFLVNSHTLIPRADTEVLVATALTFIQNSLSKNSKLTILDMGTGSGCVAISLAMALQDMALQDMALQDIKQPLDFQIIATDFSFEALKVAQKNAERNKVNVKFLQGDWFSPFYLEQKFNIIVSNPPYIDPHDSHLAELIDEPITALVADNDGLADIFHIIEHAKKHLVNGGLLAIEHGYNQGEQVRDFFIAQGFYQVTTQQDIGENDRVTYGIYKPCHL